MCLNLGLHEEVTEPDLFLGVGSLFTFRLVIYQGILLTNLPSCNILENI